MAIETSAGAAGESVLEGELTGLIERSDAVKANAMTRLDQVLDAAVEARAQVWQAAVEAAAAGNPVVEISRKVAGKGLAGEEMVRVHIAASKRLAAVRRVLDLGIGGVADFQVVPDSPRGQVGRVTGVSLIHAPTEKGAVIEERATKVVLELLRAAGFIPASGLRNKEAVEILASGSRLPLDADPTFS